MSGRRPAGYLRPSEGAGAVVRTTTLDEHVVRITSYGNLICFHPGCPCDSATAETILAWRPQGKPGWSGVTLGDLVAAVEAHRKANGLTP
jgi:hypothetical protein